MIRNLILDTDSYKTSHFKQYPPEVSRVRSYIEPRGVSDALANALDREKDDIYVVNFGSQMFARYLNENPVTQADIDEAEEICKLHGVPFNREGWEHIVEHFDGYLPVAIDALPEGTVFKPRNAQVQIHNLGGKETRWVTSYIETALLRAIWYPSTVATISYNIRRTIREQMIKTCDTLDKLPFMLHDFGSRGVSSKQSAGIGGLAHLTCFQGTDTMEALLYGRQYYEADCAGFSIPAAEHSTITSWGEDREAEAYRNMVTQFGGDGKLFAVVGDSYDIRKAVRDIVGGSLADIIRANGGTFVVRPDSGDPATVVRDVLDILSVKFGYTTNRKGYRVLPDCVRVIQGDGINGRSIKDIMVTAASAGYSADNYCFGMGGALLQHCDRDWLAYAMKTNQVFDAEKEEYRDVYKRPLTDVSKASKAGKQIVTWQLLNKAYTTQKDPGGLIGEDYLKRIYTAGLLGTQVTLDAIRANINNHERVYSSMN